jgi:hypothetical protein
MFVAAGLDCRKRGLDAERLNPMDDLACDDAINLNSAECDAVGARHDRVNDGQLLAAASAPEETSKQRFTTSDRAPCPNSFCRWHCRQSIADSSQTDPTRYTRRGVL